MYFMPYHKKYMSADIYCVDKHVATVYVKYKFLILYSHKLTLLTLLNVVCYIKSLT